MTVVSDFTAILTNSSWNGAGVNSHSAFVTYSFETSAPAYWATNLQYSAAAIASFKPFDATDQALARAALQQWDDISGVKFLEVPAGQGDIKFTRVDFNLVGQSNFSGYAYYPAVTINGNASSDVNQGGDVFINTNVTDSLGLLLHEIGHSIGLKHPFDGDPTLTTSMDNKTYTVMSYTGGSPTALGPLDVQAARYKYGTIDGSFLSAWSWNASSYELTLVGTGASETISGTSVRDIIIGGDGADQLVGFAGNDYLDGGSGIDTLVGGDGDDELVGGSGADKLFGGTGTNTVSYVSAQSGVIASLSSPAGNTGDAAGDTYTSIQNLKGSGAADSLTGDDSGNVLSGLNGADILIGLGGADTLAGGQGIDTLIGGRNNDRFVFDASALPDANGSNFDYLVDYDRGFYGFYYKPESDIIDLTGLLSTAYAAGQPVHQLVRLVQDLDGSYANLQVDRDGSAGGVAWTTVARVIGQHESETASVAIYPGSPTLDIVAQENAGLAGDFNGDGRSDLLFRNDSGSLATWLLNGTAITGSGSPGGPGNAWHVIGIGDFNGDSKSDILFRNDDNTLAQWNMNGTAIASGVTLASQPGADWHVAAVADFNGDSKADILWRNDSGLLALWSMNGGTIVSGPQLGSTPALEWHIAGTGDFNGDGKADILWRHDNGAVAMWLMNGSTILAGPQIAAPDPYWHVAGVLDVNGDGRDDILWRHDNGLVHVWEMNGAGVAAYGDIGQPDPSWQIAGTGDFNADGHDDIAWRRTDGTVAEWLLSGTAIVSGGNVGGPGNEWKIQTHDYDFV